MTSPEIIRGLQLLRARLTKDAETEEAFFALEYALLDVLHRQRVAGPSEQFADKQKKLLEQCDLFALAHVQVPFAQLCTFQSSTLIDVSKTGTPSLDNDEVWMTAIQRMVSVQLLTRFIPIAYCYQQTERTYPLVTITFDATELTLPCTANIIVSFADFGAPVKRTSVIEVGKRQQKQFLPPLRIEDLWRVRGYCPVKLYVEITFLFASRTSIPWSDTFDGYFYPRTVAVLWSMQKDRTWLDCTSLLAAWVTPEHTKIQDLHRKAIACHPEGEFRGYPHERTGDLQRRAVRIQVQALFQALSQEISLAYAISSDVVQPESDHAQYLLQNVRLPADIIAAGGPANCLDGCLLFASLLEKTNLYPALLLYQGHAVVGWRVYPEKRLYEFLETTSINQGDFALSLQQGQNVYQKAYPKGFARAVPTDILNDPLLIDIADCRKKNIFAMDW